MAPCGAVRLRQAESSIARAAKWFWLQRGVYHLVAAAAAHSVCVRAFSYVSDHDPYDLKGPRSQQSLGRIKISPEKGTSIIDRVEFPNVWLSAETHGCVHDGFQGEGALDLKVEWKREAGGTETATIRVTPWLAFACSLGARFWPVGACP